ncbi:MAG TPA: hypothetical protein VF490_13480 [Chryseosolibacter sp.]
MKKLFTIAITFAALAAAAQQTGKRSVVIGSMTTKPNALLIINPPNSDQGALLPQLSSGQRLALKPSSPAEDGLIVFDTNLQSYYYWSKGSWSKLDASSSPDYYSIDPASFRGLKSANPLESNLALFETDNSFVTVVRDGLGEQIVAPVDLPHGAAIKEMTVYYMDNDMENIHVDLLRQNLAGASETMLGWTSSGTIPSVRSESFTSFNGLENIDLENYRYRIIVTFDLQPEDIVDQPSQAQQRIYGVKIKYQQ